MRGVMMLVLIKLVINFEVGGVSLKHLLILDHSLWFA